MLQSWLRKIFCRFCGKKVTIFRLFDGELVETEEEIKKDVSCRLAAKRKEQANQVRDNEVNIVPENEISEDEQDEGSAFSISM